MGPGSGLSLKVVIWSGVPATKARLLSDLEAGNAIEFSGDFGINLMSGEVRVSNGKMIRRFTGCQGRISILRR